MFTAWAGLAWGQGGQLPPRAPALPPQLPPQAKFTRKIVPFSFGDFKLTLVNNVIEERK